MLIKISNRTPHLWNIFIYKKMVSLILLWLLRLKRIWHPSPVLSSTDRWRRKSSPVLCLQVHVCSDRAINSERRLTVGMSLARLPWQCQCHNSSRGSEKLFAEGLNLIAVEPYTNMLEWNRAAPFFNLQKKGQGGRRTKASRWRKIVVVNR